MTEIACKTTTNLYEIYKCEICGNIVEVIHTGAKALVCCKQPMIHEISNIEEDEKHHIVVDVTAHGINVKAGSAECSIGEKQYIEWISVISDNKEVRKFFQIGEKPVANFELFHDAKNIIVRSYCNTHGLRSIELKNLK